MATKVCSGCNAEKLTSEFTRDKGKPDGLRTQCTPCTRAKQKTYRDSPAGQQHQKGYQDSYRRTPQGRRARKASSLRFHYRITVEQYEAMLARQGGRCAICETGEPGGAKNVFQVDHDHATGAIRGLLCFRCNNGISCFADSLSVLKGAVSYLERGSCDSGLGPAPVRPRRADA